jgi:hypothetical protein
VDYVDNGNAVQGKGLAGEMLSEEFFSDWGRRLHFFT